MQAVDVEPTSAPLAQARTCGGIGHAPAVGKEHEIESGRILVESFPEALPVHGSIKIGNAPTAELLPCRVMETKMIASEMATRLGLKPHPEGGWFRETHRSTDSVEWKGALRAASTSILFLLEHPGVSRLHRIDAEEIWYWHAGSALEVHEIRPDGERRVHRLGPDADFQAAIPAGSWFGAELVAAGAWALVGCTVAPGFEFSGFELGKREELVAMFPEHADLVNRLVG